MGKEMKIYHWLVLVAVIFQGEVLAGDAQEPKKMKWSFDGIFGKFDRGAAGRGFKVYKEVCAACHSMKLISYRNLTELGYSSEEAKAIASEYEVTDGPNDMGEMFTRKAKPSDRFVSPYPNEHAARAANNGAFPPDLSLIVKARHNGANYIYSLLTGFNEPLPSGKIAPENMHYNPYFAGGFIAMAPPLAEGQVSFDDETAASVHQMSKDVVTFLQWASEPEMEQRKKMGIKVVIYLIITTYLLYRAKKIVWRNVSLKK
jgi:ubiquinol-cytochrome c reductase cytochrome c1 subunit